MDLPGGLRMSLSSQIPHGTVFFQRLRALSSCAAGRLTAGSGNGASAVKLMKSALIVFALAVPVATPAMALEPLSKEAHINGTLLQGFIADAIADNCPTMRPRKLRALNELTRLRDYALKKGYKAAELRAFVESKTEKARGKGEAAAWLKKQGATPGKADAYCKVGEAEIAKKSLIGQLLRSVK